MDLTRVRVRAYIPADRAHCLTLFDSNIPDSFTVRERPEFEAFLDHLPGPYFIVELESGLALACGGYAQAEGTSCADLCWGMVEHGLQGAGLGRLLTEHRLQQIRQDPRFTEVALRTSHLSRAFYERIGFTTERVTADGIAPGLHKCEMRLRMSPPEPVSQNDAAGAWEFD